MKLIIDIDERAYKGCMELKSNDDMGLLGLHLINATANGTPLEEELEKIKTDIDEMLKSDEVAEDKFLNVIINKSYLFKSIINKHIAELKGEQKW